MNHLFLQWELIPLPPCLYSHPVLRGLEKEEAVGPSLAWTQRRRRGGGKRGGGRRGGGRRGGARRGGGGEVGGEIGGGGVRGGGMGGGGWEQ